MLKMVPNSIIATLLITIFLMTAISSIVDKSAAYDEPAHLVVGLSYWQTGDPRLNWDHPPLARLVATFPLMFMGLSNVSQIAPQQWSQAAIPEMFTDALFPELDGEALFRGRMAMVLVFGGLLGIMIYLWGSELFGSTAALLPLTLYAFCPVLLAHAPLVMTDFPLSTFYFTSVYAWWRYLRKPDSKRLFGVCLAVGICFVIKISSILLAPTMFLLGALYVYLPDNSGIPSITLYRRLFIASSGLFAIALAVVLIINIAYLFDDSFLIPSQYKEHAQALYPAIRVAVEHLSDYWPTWLPLPLPFYYVVCFMYRILGLFNYRSYFMGVFTWSGGWPNYFSVLLLFKMSIPILLLSGLGLTRYLQQDWRRWLDPMFIALPPAIFLAVASTTPINIGIRHVLPVVPFLLLWSGHLGKQQSVRGRLAVGTLLVTNVVSSVAIHPHYLPYYNFLGGGAERGWGVSNYDDLGQDGKGLLLWLNEHQINHIAYAGFGWSVAVLQRAGIKFDSVPCEDTGGLVAINVSHLVMAFPSEDQARCYTWMRLREPDEKIGYTIFIYNSKNVLKKADLQKSQQYLNESLALYNIGKYQESLRASLKALQLNPSYAAAYNNVCAAYIKMGNWNDAIEACTKATALEANFSLAINNLTFAKRMAAEAKSK